MQVITPAGVAHRTKLMDYARAEAFASCLRNNGRFTGVQVQENPRAKGERRHYVAFQPASETRQAELLQGQQASREARAGSQAGDYLFVLDDSRAFFHTWNLQSGEVYETTEQSCSCPDYVERCKRAGLRCKHILILTGPDAQIQGWDPATEAPVDYEYPFAHEEREADAAPVQPAWQEPTAAELQALEEERAQALREPPVRGVNLWD